MTDPLPTYLHDHLAGSRFAINLLESMVKQYLNEPMGKFAEVLVLEIKQDQEVLEKIIEGVGGSGRDLKETAAWLAEKISQLKLGRDGEAIGIGTFEALESLTLGIRGKLGLWRVLPILRKVDARIPDIDFEQLAARAEEQFVRVDTERLRLAPSVFANRA